MEALGLFSVLLGRLQVALGGVELRPWEALGGQGKPRPPERWLESRGRSLDDNFAEALSCQVWSSCVRLRRLEVAQGDVKLRPRISQEVRGSPELQNGGLRALEVSRMKTSRMRHFSVKFPANPVRRKGF